VCDKSKQFSSYFCECAFRRAMVCNAWPCLSLQYSDCNCYFYLICKPCTVMQQFSMDEDLAGEGDLAEQFFIIKINFVFNEV